LLLRNIPKVVEYVSTPPNYSPNSNVIKITTRICWFIPWLICHLTTKFCEYRL